MESKRKGLLIGHTQPLVSHLRSSAGDLSRPTFSENQGGGPHTGGFFCVGLSLYEKIARSEQLRDRYVTFVQEGWLVMCSCIEQFNEQAVCS